jgi:hypothetical protein
MLAMPLAVLVADMQYSFLGLQSGFFGIDSSTVGLILKTTPFISGCVFLQHILMKKAVSKNIYFLRGRKLPG